MHHFAIVAGRAAGSGMPPPGSAVLDEGSPGEVTRPVEQHVRWASPDGSLQFASWSAGELVAVTRRTDAGGLVAIAGQPVVTQPADEARLLDASAVPHAEGALRDLTARLDGPFAVASLAADGSAVVVCDPFGLQPIYHGETAAVSVVANRASLVAAVLARATGRPPEIDEDGVAWVLLNGQMFGDATGHRGVGRLPFGAALERSASGAVGITRWHEPPWPVHGEPTGAGPLAVDGLEALMVASIRAAVRGAPDEVTSELTGGRDSRMVLDLAALGGLTSDLRFCTYASPASPDALAAAEIAARLGIAYESKPWPAPPVGPSLEKFVAHVRHVGAQLGCWESAMPSATPGITLSGLTGESLRTNYPQKAGRTTVEAATEAFDAHRFGRYHYVREPALRDLHERARRLYLSPLEGGARPEDLFDIFYVQHRLRRWIGDKPDRFERYVFPLYSPSGVRVAMHAGWESRTAAAIHHAVGARAALPVGEVTFAQGTHWRTKAAPAASPPVAAPPARRPGDGNAPPDAERIRRQAFDDAIDFDPASRAFDLVDRDVMRADVARYADLDRRQKVELHQALTVVLWFGVARPDRAPG